MAEYAAHSVNLNKFLAPEFIYGTGSRLLAIDYCRNLELEHVLVVSDEGVVRAGWTGEIVRLLEAHGIVTELFSNISENPKDSEVAAGAVVYHKSGASGIIAVGGGSVIDCAKGIGVVVSNDRPIGDFEGVDKVSHAMPPLICIPTTAGSSADVSQFAIINDSSRRVKFAVISKALVPDIALIDPLTLTTMDNELTAATGMDALSHAFEAYVSNGAFFLTDGFALEAVDLVARNLHACVSDPKDIYARSGMMRASLLAGLSFSNASLGAVHALAHAVGGLTDISHGICNAVLLNEVVRANYSSASDAYDRLGAVLRAGLGLPPVRPDDTVRGILEALTILTQRCGLDLSLSSRGLESGTIHQSAVNASKDPCLLTNPRKLSVAELEEILRRV